MNKRGQVEVAIILLAVVGSLIFFGASTAPNSNVQLSPSISQLGISRTTTIVIMIVLLVVFLALAAFLVFIYLLPMIRTRKEALAEPLDKFDIAINEAERALSQERLADAETAYEKMQEVYLSLDDKERKAVIKRAEKLYSDLDNARKEYKF